MAGQRQPIELVLAKGSKHLKNIHRHLRLIVRFLFAMGHLILLVVELSLAFPKKHHHQHGNLHSHQHYLM